MFRDHVIIVKNLSRPFLLGVAIQRINRTGMGYSTDGRHFIKIKGEVIAQSCHSTIGEPVLKTKGTLTPATKVENVCSINWSTLDDARSKTAKQVADLPETKELVKQLLLKIPPETNLQLEANTKDTHETVTPNADIPEEARARLKELLEMKYTSIILQSATDITRTDLLELDIPTEGLPIASKPYSVPLM